MKKEPEVIRTRMNQRAWKEMLGEALPKDSPDISIKAGGIEGVLPNIG